MTSLTSNDIKTVSKIFFGRNLSLGSLGLPAAHTYSRGVERLTRCFLYLPRGEGPQRRRRAARGGEHSVRGFRFSLIIPLPYSFSCSYSSVCHLAFNIFSCHLQVYSSVYLCTYL